MAVSCAICGEELLGSVNRCWKCGNFVTSHPGDATQPPVRTDQQAPAVPSGLDGTGRAFEGASVENENAANNIAEQAASADPGGEGGIAESQSEMADTQGMAEAGSGSALTAELVDDVAAPTTPEIHFPGDDLPNSDRPSRESLDTPKLAEPVASSRAYVPPVKPAYTNSSLSTAGAFSSLVLGMIALVASYFTIASLFPAVLGIAMGVWGIFSNQRTVALVGLVFCVLAFGAGLFHVAIWVFESIYGISPFDQGVNEIPT